MHQIERVCQTLSGYKLLLSIPGFGTYIAALVLAALYRQVFGAKEAR